MTSYEYLDGKLTGRCSEARKVANNTYAERRGPDAIAIRLHSTDVVTFNKDGRVILSSGGWKTSTTKQRITENAVRISQCKGVWYFNYGGNEYVFADGVTLHPDGTVTGAAAPEAQTADKALLKRIKAYAAKCGQALPLPLPSTGDCLYCQCTAESGGNFGGRDHLLSHLDEGYVVPSLVYKALKAAGAGQAHFWGAFEGPGEGRSDWLNSLCRTSVPRAVAKLLKRELGLVS